MLGSYMHVCAHRHRHVAMPVVMPSCCISCCGQPVFCYQLQVLRSALHEAVLYGHLHVAEALLEAKALIDTLDAVTSLRYCYV